MLALGDVENGLRHHRLTLDTASKHRLRQLVSLILLQTHPRAATLIRGESADKGRKVQYVRPGRWPDQGELTWISRIGQFIFMLTF